MKSVSRLAPSILAAGIVAGLPAAVFAADPPSTQPAFESRIVIDTQADARVREAISSIEKAPDPSTVVEAYANATEKDSVPLKQAYVKRLAALGVPELAETQARDLAQRGPGDGLAWAVVAFMDARRNNTPAALKDIVTAARLLPDDPFVERTAAQIIAYYEVYADQNKIDAGLRDSVDQTQKSLGAKPAFAQAFQQAKLAYTRATARLTPTEPDPILPAEPYPAAPTIVYNNTYTSYTDSYPDPYAYDAYAPYPWLPSAWWWDPGIVVVDGRFIHDRFDHRFGDRDHRFDGRFDRGFDGRGGREPEVREFRGGAGEMRSMPQVRTTPMRPSAPFRPSNGFYGAGARPFFGSPVRGGTGGHMEGSAMEGGGHFGGGGGHR
jgi:hypothetical protein